MTDESITEMLTRVTQPDVIIFAAGLGGALLWAWWYRKGSEKDYFFNIDTTQKRIRLGLYPSVLVALLAGSAVGFYANGKGWEANDAAFGAFFVGLLTTWIVRSLLNNSYTAVCKIAQSKWFADNVGTVLPARQPRALPSPRGDPVPSSSPLLNVTPSAVQTWPEQRTRLTEQFIILKQRGAINENELIQLHRLLPEAPDLEDLQQYTANLMQQQQSLTIGQKTDLTRIILTQQNQIQRQSELIDLQQERLERAGLTLEPQNRIPREVVYVTLGAVLRHVVGWIL